MNLFGCHHYWKTLSTDYTQGLTYEQSYNANWPYGPRPEEMTGTTHIYQRCKYCGLIKQYDVVGKFNPKGGVR